MKQRISWALIAFLLLGILACRKDDDLDVKSIKELENRLEEELTDNSLTSISYAIVKDDALIHSGAKGYADVDNAKLASDNTRYLIASVSKTITAVALMKLVDQNVISLDDDINPHLPFSVRNPNFPSDPITFRMLLSHTSSISDNHQNTLDLYCYGTDCSMSLGQFMNDVFVSTGQYYSPDNFSNSEPGTNEDYSNLGFALIGYLVERIAQTPFDAFCDNNIFLPLGMNSTEWRLANTPLSDLAIPYSPDITSTNPHYTFPDYPNGGLRTNALDLGTFLRMIIDNGTTGGTRILSPESMAEMKTLQFGSTTQCLSFYYETFNGRTVLGHSGGEMGVTTEMFYDPATNVGVVVLCNDDDAALDAVVSLLFSYGEKQ